MKRTTRSGSRTATGSSSTAFTTEKTAVVVPMPRVSAARAATVNEGLFANPRRECLRSFSQTSSMQASWRLWSDTDPRRIGSPRPAAVRLNG